MDVSVLIQYFLNHRFDQREVRWQTQQFADAGIQAVFPHARTGMLTPFLSDDWWKTLDTILEVCRETGMAFWIWDEDYFPSGLAGGRIVWENPGLVSRELAFTTARFSGEGPFELDFAPGMLVSAAAYSMDAHGGALDEIDIMSACGTRRQDATWSRGYIRHQAYSPMIDKVGHPHWRSVLDDNRFAVSWMPPKPGEYLIVGTVVGAGHSAVHPDLLRPEGIQRFIEICYEPYFQRYGKDFGTLIKGTFTDEPSPGAMFFPWTADFPAQFKNDHGYDLLPLLAHVGVDIDNRSAMVRHHYRLTQHRLQRTNYVDAIARWCREHKLTFSGHLTRTEWLSLVAAWWPNEIRMYKEMQVPCADPLGASEGWPDAAAYTTGLKVVSSAAHLFGRKQSGTDVLAVVGDEAGLRDLKYLLDHQMVLGINFFVVHGSSYSLAGARKDEVPPSLFYQHTQWQQMPALFNYVAETCAQLTGGEHLCEIAVLYPSTSLACQITAQAGNACADLPDETLIHGVTESLVSHQRDFDFIDEVTLQESVAADGSITTPERYSVILLPHLRFIDEGASEALLRFAKAGGRVITIGRVPRAITHDPANPSREWLDNAIESVEALDEAVLESLPGVEVVGEGARDIHVLRRRKTDGDYTFILNRRGEVFAGAVDGHNVTIAPRGSVLLTPLQPEQRDLTPKACLAELSTDWHVELPQNHMPLNFWHVDAFDAESLVDPFKTPPTFDLMRREAAPASPTGGRVRYLCRFMLTGQVPDAEIVAEDGGLGENWQLSVNGVAITDWQPARKPDVSNLAAAVGHALRSGSVPTLNVVTIESWGGGRGFSEMPYLYGRFDCEYRHGHASFPFVQASESQRTMPTLLPWNVMGRPTFSGTVTYRKTINVPEGGSLALDLGRVEDVATVWIDGKQVAVLAWPPYVCLLGGIAPGSHELKVQVTNPPGNRNRNSHLPAGLLGPVRIVRI